jgi:hypothetical protein
VQQVNQRFLAANHGTVFEVLLQNLAAENHTVTLCSSIVNRRFHRR